MTKGVIKENFHVFYLKLLDNYIYFFICIFFIFAFCHMFTFCVKMNVRRKRKVLWPFSLTNEFSLMNKKTKKLNCTKKVPIKVLVVLQLGTVSIVVVLHINKKLITL